ncbi:MAG: YoaK family protein [Acidimicrobiales bacterium]
MTGALSSPRHGGDMADDANRARDRASAGLIRLLLALTVVTGIVDAVSILRLGHVFVANMTGNLVFLGFALAGASGFSVLASLTAVAAFVVGAAAGARLPSGTPAQVLGRMAAIEAALAAGATVVAAVGDGAGARYAITVLLALAMGGQNATVRKLAIPDMTTTVLTLTLTGLAADAPDLRTPGSHTRRRTVAVAAMLGGAVLGALVVLHASTAWALAAATAVLAAVAIGAFRLAHRTRPAGSR